MHVTMLARMAGPEPAGSPSRHGTRSDCTSHTHADIPYQCPDGRGPPAGRMETSQYLAGGHGDWLELPGLP
jgi:hypothetical protein